MKQLNVLALMLSLFLFTSCKDAVDPVVETLHVNGDYEAERREAFPKLLDLYEKSAKDKEYYEVVAKGDFIVSFSPAKKLLTLCADQGSGWVSQYKDFDIKVLQKLVSDEVTVDEITSYETLNNMLGDAYKGILIKNEPFYEVKTNGNPRLWCPVNTA
jgi:hypothetical protein